MPFQQRQGCNPRPGPIPRPRPSQRTLFLSESRCGYAAGAPMPDNGDLSRWASQGVLLLNATLTVEEHRAGSHQGKGWETFTDHVISTLSQQRDNLVFILWGSYAKSKSALIDHQRHMVLTSPHPSPLSAHRGFFGNHHFSTANAYLASHGRTPIIW